MNYKDLALNPVSIVIQLVGSNKWKILIVSELLKQDLHFVELKKRLHCTAKVLTSSLKEMEVEGLIVRKIIETKPLRVKYSLTEIGCTLFPVIDVMEKWGKDYKKLKKLMEKQKLASNIKI